LKLACCALLCCLVLVPSVHAQGEPLPGSVSWQALLALIQARSPRLVALRSQGKVADAETRVAGVLPNPSLDYTGFGRLSHANNYGTQHQIGIEQPILIAGQRGAHVEAAKRRAEAVRAEIAVSESDLEREALHAWAELLATQERLAELTRAHTDVDAVSHTVHERVAAGAEAQYDASRVELESAQLDARVASAAAEVKSSSAELAQTLGLPAWQPQAQGEFAPIGVGGDFEQLWHDAQRKLPLLRAGERRTFAAQSEIEVARAERWGIPSVNGGTFLTTDQGSTSIFLGFSFPLPLFNFGGAALDRAAAGLAAAEADRDADRARAEAALKGALVTLAARRAALDTYDRGVANRLPGLREMAETAYRSGSASLLELLDSVRSAIEVRLARIEIVGQVLQAEFDVLLAAGALHGAAAGTPGTGKPAPH
jgi:cobalt-zinc-cadmium efflux system outer membrane protein